MQFILDRQAETTLHQEKTDRQISAILKLLQAGTKMLVGQQEKLEGLDRKVDPFDLHLAGQPQQRAAPGLAASCPQIGPSIARQSKRSSGGPGMGCWTSGITMVILEP